MKNRQLLVAIVIAATTAAWHGGLQAQTAPATQSSTEAGVTLKVTPRPGPAEWAFSIALDTHSASLDDELDKSAVLVVDGQELAPLKWSGAAPGGHHRQGVLSFPAPAKAPSTVELRIQRAGEAAPRVFRWDGAALR